VIVYLLASALIPSWGWMYSATCRLNNRHARAWSRPRPLRQRHHGAHVRPSRYVGRHRTAGVTV